MVPEFADKFLQGAVGGADADVVSDDIVGGDGDRCGLSIKHDSSGEGVLAPGGEGVLVEFVDSAGVIVVRAGGKGRPAGGIVDGGGGGA